MAEVALLRTFAGKLPTFRMNAGTPKDSILRADLSILQWESLWQENGTLFPERSRVFFPIEAEEWSQALGRIRRLRHSRNWQRIGSSDLYWTAPFLAALVETVDSLLVEEPEVAFELSAQGILVAQRMRSEASPGGSESAKRSLSAWAYAVHGSACRASGRLSAAEAAFQSALALVAKRTQPWAAAETWRRYAVLLLALHSLAGLDFVDRAIDSYAGFPLGRADSLVLRGMFHFYLRHDHSAAVTDTGAALELLDSRRSPREARSWQSAIQNLGNYYARGTSDLETLSTSLKRVREAHGRLSRHEPFRRRICLWVQGLLLAPLGATRKAVRLLAKAADWMQANGKNFGFSLCSVDLAILHFRNGDMDMAREVLSSLMGSRRVEDEALQAFLESRLEELNSRGLSERSLAGLREALELYRPPMKAVQPLGGIDGSISSAGISPDTESAAG